MLSLLATSSSALGESVQTISSVGLNWIGQVIKWLIEGVGIVGVGIIVFTLILKTIVLPLDIYSRIKTKKQSLLMEKMRPQMEKLQKQYANDKQMYSQKVMELQKKNGYSMFGACLPMIVSLVIFIIVFNAFSTYSQYANLESYNGMVKAYNNVVQTFVIEEGENDDNNFLIKVEEEDENGKTAVSYYVDYDAFTDRYNAEKRAEAEAEGTTYTDMTEYQVFCDLIGSYQAKYPSKANFDTSVLDTDGDGICETTEEAEAIKMLAVDYYISVPAAKAVQTYYEKNNNKFLWVGNLWYPDSMLNKEIPDFSKFQSTVSQANISSSYEESYNKVTANLTQEKNTYNGYFVLIVLSIGFMLLQQFISMRANKAVNDLGTVDGSGARTNKYMLIMMPIIYGIFSFFYSAAFSIYMITNTLYSIITTLIINKSLDVWFRKKEQAEEWGRINRKPKNGKKGK